MDKELGAERTHVVGKGHAGAGYSDTNGFGGSSTANGGKAKSEWDALATEQGEQWSGWYSQLKPAHEPICLTRKPLDGTLAHNLLGHGTGALHIDACRVPFRNTADEKESKNKNRHADFNSGPRDNHIYGADKADRTDYTAEARFTPNMLFDQSTAKELDRQSGVTVSRKGRPRASTKPGDGWGMTHTGAEYDDAGGASRFYPVFRYCPKAGPGERPTVDGILHPTVKPLELMRWLVRLVTPPDGLVLEPFAGSGAALEACRIEDVRCVAAEMDSDYVRLIARRMARPTNPVLFWHRRGRMHAGVDDIGTIRGSVISWPCYGTIGIAPNWTASCMRCSNGSWTGASHPGTRIRRARPCPRATGSSISR